MTRAIVSVAVAMAALASAATVGAAPVHPLAIRAASGDATEAVSLAGPRVVWDARLPKGRHWLYASSGGKPSVIKRFNPKKIDEYYTGDQLVALAGSKQLVAWDYVVINDDGRLSYAETDSFEIFKKGSLPFAFSSFYGCWDPYVKNDGVDVDGPFVAIGFATCTTKTNLAVLDYRGLRRKVTRIRGRYPIGGVRVAGRYIAWREFEFFIDRIVVYDWVAHREVYRYTPPDEAGLTFDLQADGKLALTYQPNRAVALGRIGWLSPSEPTFHPMPGTPDFSGVHISGDRIAYTRVARNPHERDYPFVVAGLDGQVLSEIRAPGRSFLEDFDGRCAAWMDASHVNTRLTRVMVSPVPGGPGITLPGDACGYVVIASSRVKRQGRIVQIPITCRASAPPGCSGLLKLAADGGRPVGVRHFRVAPGRTAQVPVRISAAALRTPHSLGQLRLRVSATVRRIRGVGGSVAQTVFATPGS
jgi:hypothetical protein